MVDQNGTAFLEWEKERGSKTRINKRQILTSERLTLVLTRLGDCNAL